MTKSTDNSCVVFIYLELHLAYDFAVVRHNNGGENWKFRQHKLLLGVAS